MIKYFVVLFFCLATIVSVSAQQKIAFVDVESLMRGLESYQQIQQDLESYQIQLVKQLDKEKRAIATYYKEMLIEIQQGSLTPTQQQDAEAKLQAQQSQLEKNTAAADRKILKRQQTLTQPLYDVFEAALKSEAKKRNIAYILDASTIMNSYKAIDLTEALKKYFK